MRSGTALPIRVIPISFVFFVMLFGALASFVALTPNRSEAARSEIAPNSIPQRDMNRARKANMVVLPFVIFGVVSSVVGLVLARTWVAKEHAASKGKVSGKLNSAMVVSLAIGESGVMLAIVAGLVTKTHLHWIAAGAYVFSVMLGVLPLAWSLQPSEG